MQLGQRTQILPPLAERVFVVVAVTSIACTPLLYALGTRMALRARARARAEQPASPRAAALSDHAIIVGYGPTGRAVAAGLRAVGIPFVVSEMNAATVKAEREKGVPIVLGDATRVAVLHSLGIGKAKIVVLAVNDSAATSRVAQLARRLAPDAHVLARAVYSAEADGLRRAGAHDVVPQELEASVEMLARVLRRFLIADDEIQRQVNDVRQRAGSTRRAPLAAGEAADIAEFVPGIGFGAFKVQSGAAAAGRTLAAVGVRRLTACSVVAVRRGDSNLPAITPDTVLEVGDTVVVIGAKGRLADAAAMFAAPASVAEP
jgi:CPA2 family monovalent cation:H+ antiporter-2